MNTTEQQASVAMKLSEKAVSAIARALVNDHKALSKSLAFWATPGRAKQLAGRHVESITEDLRENAKALTELADTIAPWLKQRADWQSIAERALNKAAEA